MQPLEIAAAIAAVGAALAVVAGAARWLSNRWRQVADFLADWNGQAARPGVRARPGVLERLAAIETEVALNGGRSLKDCVVRTHEAVEAMRLVVDDHLQWHRNGGAIDPTAVSLTHRGRARQERPRRGADSADGRPSG